MQWLIDLLREPVAALSSVVLSAASLWLANRIRGKQRQSVERLDELDRQVGDIKRSG